MGRQIIQTNGPGRVRAMRRRVLKVLVAVVVLVAIVASLVLRAGVGTHPVVGSTRAPLITWTTQPIRLPGVTPVPAQPR